MRSWDMVPLDGVSIPGRIFSPLWSLWCGEPLVENEEGKLVSWAVWSMMRVKEHREPYLPSLGLHTHERG